MLQGRIWINKGLTAEAAQEIVENAGVKYDKFNPTDNTFFGCRCDVSAMHGLKHFWPYLMWELNPEEEQ